MLNATTIGRMMQAYSRRIGDPTGTLVITHPQTITPAPSGHPFMRAASGGTLSFTYADVRGDWSRQREANDPDGMGRVDGRSGECWLSHAQFQTDYVTLRTLLKREGAIATWEGVRIQIDQLVEDGWQDCTVVGFTRADTG